MKLFVFVISLFIIDNSFAQLTTKVTWTEQTSLPATEVIYYTGKNLVWDNFAAKPPEDKSTVAAMTVAGFGYNAGMKTVNGKGELTISVYCYFSKNKSWVKPGKNTPYILNHEQHHFDVSYIAATAFMEKLQSAKFTTKNYNVLLPQIYNECCNSMNKMQDDYDGQTKNGQVKEEQSKWNAFIDKKLSTITR